MDPILDLIKPVFDSVKKTYHTVAFIVDDQKDRRFRESLVRLATKMVELNSNKRLAQSSLKDYDAGFFTTEKSKLWAEVTSRVPPIAASLNEVIDQLVQNRANFTQAAGLVISSQLEAELKQQREQYAKLVDIKEPIDRKELKELEAIADKLESLLQAVQEHESALDVIIKRLSPPRQE